MHNAEKIIFAAGSVLAVSAPAYFIFEDDWSYDFHAFFHGVLGYLERDGVEVSHLFKHPSSLWCSSSTS